MIDFRHNRRIAALLAVAMAGLVPVRADFNPQRVGLSTNYPTSYAGWPDALMAGNGKMGIMVFGNPLEETVVFDDRGFFLAKTRDRSFAQVSAADLETIKDDCVAEKFADADTLAVNAADYHDGGEGSKHPGFGMFISIPPDGAVTRYSRLNNFSTGEIVVKWSDNRGDWVRKAFVSRKDDVTVQSLSAPTHGGLTCSIRLGTDPGMDLPHEMIFSQTVTPDMMNIRAFYRPKLDVGYEGATRVVVSGGTESVDGDTVHIANARSVLLLTRTRRYFDHCAEQWNREDIQKQLAAMPADYDRLLQGQIATHEAIYDRVKLDLGATAAERAKTNQQLLDEQKASPTPVKALWERMFDSGRYYYLSSSSEDTPPDLLGIWTGNSHAGWGGFYHLDANLNIQISQGNIGDMPEAMAGYFRINESWRPDFEINARKLLGCRGMLAGGNSPGPGQGLMAQINYYYPYQYATGEEGWLLYPFWEHYLVTGDTTFLREQLYPLLKDMGYFYEDFLTKTQPGGTYIFAGSVSPENQPSNVHVSLVDNSVFDISGARFVLSTLVQTCRLLDVDQGPGGEAARWAQILKRLPPYLVNSDGALKEWAWPGLKDDYGHRHSSGLLPVWPYQEITPESNPTLYKAALVTQAKKDASNITPGHGIVHGALIAADLKDPESVRARLMRLARDGYYFENLFTSHSPDQGLFCADVCNTVPAVMMEMLISSQPGTLEFLPALPRGLEVGAISGVKGRNRVTIVSLSWNMGDHAVKAVVKSDIDQDLTLIERDGIESLETSVPASPSPLGEIARVVRLKAGVATPLSIGLGALRPRPVNLALGRPVTVSSTKGDFPAANAVDDDTATRWASDDKDDQWIYVDLGAPKHIDEIKLDWETAAGRDYDLEVSDDAQNWTMVKSVTGNSSIGWLDYPGLDAHGRYVRVNGRTRVTKYGFSLYEFEVFGS